MKSLSIALVASLLPLFAHATTLSISPASVIQGEPVMMRIVDAPATTKAPSTTVGGIAAPIYFFPYEGIATALYGTDINQKTSTTTVTVTLTDGTPLTSSFYIAPRVKSTESLPIPDQLGGNSAANQAAVVSILAQENVTLARIYSRTDKALWTRPFSFPVASTTASPIVITDTYGYNRDAGASTITHKGTDFRAPVGTPVYAANRGVVRMAQSLVAYGGTIVVDHGLGLLSMYMHMSKLLVWPGELVQRGELIGYSGDTGYAEGPHLHLSIRIGGVSIDPIGFYGLVGNK